MNETFSDSEFRRPIWLVGHSRPRNWVRDLNTPLDPRHPTRHSIWTSVADYLQDRLFERGPRLRLDVSKLLVMNAFASADDLLPRLDFTSSAIIERMAWLSKQLSAYNPRIVITFSAESYAIVNAAVARGPTVARGLLGIEGLGKQFRASLDTFDPQRINVVPLLHASVARRSWATVGAKFSGSGRPVDIYFEYVGHALGDLLLAYGRDWPIWRDSVA